MSTSNDAFGEQPLRLSRARGLDDLVSGVAQRAPERLQNFFFVVDEQNGTAMRHEVTNLACEESNGQIDADLGAAGRPRW